MSWEPWLKAAQADPIPATKETAQEEFWRDAPICQPKKEKPLRRERSKPGDGAE